MKMRWGMFGSVRMNFQIIGQMIKTCLLVPQQLCLFYPYYSRTSLQWVIKQEQIVLERSGYWIWILAEVTRVTGLAGDHLQEASSSGWLFAGGRPHWMMISKRLASLDDQWQQGDRGDRTEGEEEGKEKEEKRENCCLRAGGHRRL